MALLIECPRCGCRNTEKAAVCRGKYRSGERKGQPCGFSRLRKASGKVYWIEYRIAGRKRREKIGVSKAAAEARLLDVKRAMCEGIYLRQDRGARVTLGEVLDWYLRQNDVRKLKSFERFRAAVAQLRRRLHVDQKVKDLSFDQLEAYVETRSRQPSSKHIGQRIAPHTIKFELDLLKSILAKAAREDFITEIPLKRWPTIDADNTRERIFSPDELQRLYAVSPRWLENIIRFAVGTGCRQSEVLNLEWNQVDLVESFIKLSASQTKSKYARIVRILPDVEALLRSIPRALHTHRVFLSATGRPIPAWGGAPHRAWAKALREAEIPDAVFHDLRHTFVTNAMRAGNPAHVVMKQVGHKTESMLRRYQLINETDLQQLQLPDEPNDSARRSS